MIVSELGKKVILRDYNTFARYVMADYRKYFPIRSTSTWTQRKFLIDTGHFTVEVSGIVENVVTLLFTYVDAFGCVSKQHIKLTGTDQDTDYDFAVEVVRTIDAILARYQIRLT